jgi:WD40 repeat protein
LAAPTQAPRLPISPENVPRLQVQAQYQGQSYEQVLALAWAPDSQSLFVAAGQNLLRLSVPELVILQALEAGVQVNELALQPGGSLLAGAGQDGSLYIWDASIGITPRATIPAHKKAANAAVFSPDGGLLASGGNDGMARIWRLSDGARQAEIIGGAFAISSLAFLQDGAQLAIANAGLVRVREVQTRRITQTLRSAGPSVYSIALSPDGQRLGGGTVENQLLVWDLATAGVTWSAEPAPVSAGARPPLTWQVAYQPTGELLAAASGDSSLSLWEAQSGELLGRFPAHDLGATCLAFSPDGLWLASGGLDGVVRLWGIE